jgi:hypothetical protein
MWTFFVIAVSPILPHLKGSFKNRYDDVIVFIVMTVLSESLVIFRTSLVRQDQDGRPHL